MPCKASNLFPTYDFTCYESEAGCANFWDHATFMSSGEKADCPEEIPKVLAALLLWPPLTGNLRTPA